MTKYTLEVLVEGDSLEEAIDNFFDGKILDVHHEPQTHKMKQTSETSRKEVETEFYKKHIADRLNRGG